MRRTRSKGDGDRAIRGRNRGETQGQRGKGRGAGHAGPWPPWLVLVYSNMRQEATAQLLAGERHDSFTHQMLRSQSGPPPGEDTSAHGGPVLHTSAWIALITLLRTQITSFSPEEPRPQSPISHPCLTPKKPLGNAGAHLTDRKAEVEPHRGEAPRWALNPRLLLQLNLLLLNPRSQPLAGRARET